MLERVFIALLAGGHLLLEGVPGLAKTLTVKTLADVLGGSFHRIQFTPDLVPSDLVGTRIYRPDSGAFDTELGPVFCNFLLADEINRAPAKVQSALLEVMQEHQVTIGRDTYPVPEPFLVMATQNPIESEGTYPLPEAQVDRFMMKVVGRLPGVRRGDDGRPALARRRRRGRAACCRPTELAALPAGRARRSTSTGPSPSTPSRSRPRRASPKRVRHRGDRRLHRVRREPARVDQHGPRRPRARAPARARLRPAAATCSTSPRTCCATGWC